MPDAIWPDDIDQRIASLPDGRVVLDGTLRAEVFDETRAADNAVARNGHTAAACTKRLEVTKLGDRDPRWMHGDCDPRDAIGRPLVRVVQSCPAMPTQWDAWDADGQYYYLRYRSGHGSVELAANPNDYADPATPTVVIATFDHGHDLEGEIELAKFLELAGMSLAPGANVR